MPINRIDNEPLGFSKVLTALSLDNPAPDQQYATENGTGLGS